MLAYALKYRRKFSKLLLWCLFPVFLAMAGELYAQTTAPVLRLETGPHTATVWRIGVDRAGRYLVTASQDKTARLWEVATGRLLRVLRPPLGDGDEGKLYAVAMSPDGNVIAAGGWTKLGTATHNIFLFDRASGRLLRRLTGLPNVAGHLTFSPDGTRLAATLGGSNGVRVWRINDGGLSGSDTDYKDNSFGAGFDATGRLVTSCYDGFIRLYDANMRLLAKVAAPGGKRPFGVSFTPDGSRVAVGYSDSTKVDVLSGNDLRLLYSPDTSGVDNGSLNCVAWSLDGTWLYAGGRYSVGNDYMMRRWSDAGRGAARNSSISASTILDLAPLPDGGMAFGTGEPSWGVADRQMQRTVYSPGQIADYRALRESFQTDKTGRTVRFAYALSGASPAVFRLEARALTLGAESNPQEWQSPRTTATGLSVTDWLNLTEPKLNGQPLTLQQYETARSLAFAPGDGRFLLGTDYWLRCFGRDGKELWKSETPGEAWAVNISGDGRLGLAAFADGTIRWYRLTDGKELLALFPHTDHKRWVLWTPSGYYDASPGADDIIGWHVNNGADAAADFFPVAQFRDTYYRPDVVARVLSEADEQVALRLANENAGRRQADANLRQQLPPVVEIVTPTDGSALNRAELAVRFRLRTPSGEAVTGVRVLLDGRPTEVRGLATTAGAVTCGTARQIGLANTGEICEVRVTVPEHDATLSVIAENRFTSSVPASVVLKWKGTPGATADTSAFVAKPKLYILAVGVSDYDNNETIPDLRFPAKDARDFTALMQRQKGLLYRDVEVKLLTDKDATRDNIVDALDWLLRQTTSKDMAIAFFAGHGLNDSYGTYYYLPSNADPDKLKRTGVSMSDISATVKNLAGKTLFFVDTCHAGNAVGTAARGPSTADINGLANELSNADNGAVVFAASTGRQSSLESEKWGNGAFTKALVEGLSGRADYSGKGRITINMLDLYLSERVKELTGGRQTPTTTKPSTVPDFSVVIVP